MFMTFLIEFLVILAWHGMWSIEDLWADELGHTHRKTAWLSFLAGTATNIVIFAVQFPTAKFIDEKGSKNSIMAHICGGVLSFLCLFTSVNGFRGYWFLLDEYFIPGEDRYYVLSLINGQVYGALILFTFHCGASLHAGIFSDVSNERGGNMLEYYFTSYFFIKVLSIYWYLHPP